MNDLYDLWIAVNKTQKWNLFNIRSLEVDYSSNYITQSISKHTDKQCNFDKNISNWIINYEKTNFFKVGSPSPHENNPFFTLIPVTYILH